jgi:hypothetical protein
LASGFVGVFQPFERPAPHPLEGAEDVGLGLAIVQAIADTHDAVVTAQAHQAADSESMSAFPRLHNRLGLRSGDQPAARANLCVSA